MEWASSVAEMMQYDEHRNRLCYDCGPGGSGNAHIEDEYEYRVENCIEYDSEYSQAHSLFRVAGRTHSCIQTEIQMGDYIAYEDDGHIFLRVREGILACTEEI